MTVNKPSDAESATFLDVLDIVQFNQQGGQTHT